MDYIIFGRVLLLGNVLHMRNDDDIVMECHHINAKKHALLFLYNTVSRR